MPGGWGGSHRSSTVPPSGAGPPDSSLPPHPMRSPTTALSPDKTRVPRHCAPRSQEPLSQTHLPEGQRGDTWRPEIPYPRLCDTLVGGAGHLRVRPAAQGPSALRRKSWPRPPQPQGLSTFCPCRFASSACSHVESHHSRPRGPFVKAPPSVLSLGSWGGPGVFCAAVTWESSLGPQPRHSPLALPRHSDQRGCVSGFVSADCITEVASSVVSSIPSVNQQLRTARRA